MKKDFYIIPGWEDSCDDRQYQLLAEAMKAKGYNVICKNVNWKKPLSQQVFAVSENSIIFGFSLGAILAWFVAQKYPCEQLILASMTLHTSFEDKDDKEALIKMTGFEFVDDIINNLSAQHQAQVQIIMYGELENEAGDIIVPNTEHELTDAYIKEITKIL